METELTLLCLRCGHAWLRRSLAKMPGTCPHCCSPYWRRQRRGAAPPQAKPPALPKALGLRPLTRAQGLSLAREVLHVLQGYRKNPDYRTTQNDLNFICEVLRRASAGETDNLARPLEC